MEKLIILKKLNRDRFHNLQVKVKCFCGHIFETRQSSIRNGNTKSCGCLVTKNHYFKHGHGIRGHESLTYTSWENMWQRVSNPKATRYKNYGGRGISICERWKDFRNFIKDLGPRLKGTTLDRINVNGNYIPANCRWATDKQQRANTTRSK